MDKDTLKDTVFLPTTEFPMRAGLPQKEPAMIAGWWTKQADGDVYARAMKAREGAETFLLHWGPPFANGHLHMGHSLTYILKDVVIRSQLLLGKRTPSVTGWDCHGLPIEWKVEEEYRKAGKNKDDVSVIDFRAECRAYAQKWKEVQGEEMKRFGIFADWDNPYMTMDNASEAAIAAECLKFVEQDLVYSSLRPVMWSVVEKTALAEAEIEYKEHKSTTIYVAFPVTKPSHAAVDGAHLVIWTTTPWTIPANRLIGIGHDIEYGVYDIQSQDPEAPVQFATGKKLVIATALFDTFKTHLKIDGFKQLATLKGSELAGTVCAHPLRGQDPYYGFDVRACHGDFVTTDAGTGLVHIAPSHGKDDFMLGRENGVSPENTVLDDGTYAAEVGLFAGIAVYTDEGKEGPANGAVIKALHGVQMLMGKSSMRHEYPHSWRSKSPLIFRATPQWYIELDKSGLRQKALDAIDDTEWFPSSAKNRIRAMVEGRPDWCISRQRVWGVPIAIFYDKQTGAILKDKAVNKRIIDIFTQEGADAWYARNPQDFLGDAYKADDFVQVRDVIDVWFESGSTHAFVCEARPDLKWPADLYFEGSDQHRGWFQSSLLESCGTRGRAPFKQVLTHGFLLDEKGYKMSKSLGNVMDPFKVCDEFGADILRLWTVNTDFTDDVRVGPEILKYQADNYRRLRNTLRYLLGNLDGFSAAEAVDLHDKNLPELERWVLHRLSEMNTVVREGYSRYDLNKVFVAVQNFCTVDLSAFYFDIRKDCLYCDAPSSYTRRAARTVLAKIFECLTAWLAPVLVFTTEEAWALRPTAFFGADTESVHLRVAPTLPAQWHDAALAKKWERIAAIRDVVLSTLEPKRADKTIGSSLQAAPIIRVSDAADKALIDSVDMADICIVSSLMVEVSDAQAGDVTLDDVKGVAVGFAKASGHKCERCWKVLDEVEDSGVCQRCDDAVGQIRRAA